jgi:uncharacterized membrane protein
VTAISIIRAIAIVCTGLAAGIFLGHRRGVSLAAPRLPPSAFVQLQQVIHTHFVRMMPPLILGAVVGSLTWAVLLHESWRALEFWLVASASVAMLCVLVMTRAVNLPINVRLMTWNPEAPPEDLTALWQPWERIHSIRTVLASVAFVLQVAALSLVASGGPK